MDSIWTITTISAHNRRIGGRTWGYYFSQEDAIKGMSNYVDTEAGYYTHVVIENFRPGIYAEVVSEHWFVWDGIQWASCEKPEPEKQIRNYGMG